MVIFGLGMSPILRWGSRDGLENECRQNNYWQYRSTYNESISLITLNFAM